MLVRPSLLSKPQSQANFLHREYAVVISRDDAAGSPADYRLVRGVNFHFGSGPTAAPPALPVKAFISKQASSKLGVIMSLLKYRRSYLKAALSIIAATVGFQARGVAAPVQYVKVCDLYGSGFINIPGTDTCARVSVGGQVGFGGADTHFDVNPGFDVSGSSIAYGANGMILFGLASSGLAVGPRAQYFGGDTKGSSFYPSSGGTYDVSTRSLFTGDLVVQYGPSSWRGTAIRGFVGIADTRTATEYNVLRTFVGSYTSSSAGFTGGVGLDVPITGLPGLSLTGELRYIGVNNNIIYVPGSVVIHRDIVIGTIGLEWAIIPKPFSK
jgi:hypothetical protein